MTIKKVKMQRKYYIIFQGKYGLYSHGYWNGSQFVKDESEKKLYSSLEEAEKVENDMIWPETHIVRYQ